MELKKSKKADLERSKGTFVQVGLVVALSIILIGFEWTSSPKDDDDTEMVQQIEFENEMIVTRRPPPEQPKQELPKIAQVIEMVDDTEEIEEDDLETERTTKHFTIADWKQTWMRKTSGNAVFISALNKENLETFRKQVYHAVREIHIGRFPYNNFLYPENLDEY